MLGTNFSVAGLVVVDEGRAYVRFQTRSQDFCKLWYACLSSNGLLLNVGRKVMVGGLAGA